MEKNIAYPRDVRLYLKSLELMVRISKKKGIRLRQTYTRVGKRHCYLYGRYAHARQMKRAKRELKKLQELLPTFDVAVAQYSPSNHYWLYTPKYLSGKELEDALEDLEKSLTRAGLADKALLHAIKSMQWVPSINTLLFTGDPTSIRPIEKRQKYPV